MPPADRFSPQQLSQAQTLLRQAVGLHQRGELDQARRLYEGVLKVQPTNPDALHLLGVLSAQAGNHKRAADLIGRAIAANPVNPAFFFNHGSALQQLGRFDEALAAYNNGLALKADVPEALNNRGNVLQTLNRFDEAVESYNMALRLQARNHQALNNKGNALQALHRYDDAIASYDQAIALKPGYVLALCSRGDALQKVARLEDAILSYEAALSIDPNCFEAHHKRATALLAVGRADEANAGYRRALALRPGDAAIHHDHANALQALGCFDEAADSYERAIALKPDSAESHYNRGIALHALKRFDDALDSMNKAVALNPNIPGAYLGRGLTLQELKRFQDALADYNRALTHEPENAAAYNNRGVALHALKQFQAAIASFDRALEFNPQNADAYANRGNSLHELNRLDEALASYDLALNLAPGIAGIHYNRGIALQSLRRQDEAVFSFDRALEIFPESTEAHNARANALQSLDRLDEAVASFERALPGRPDFAYGAYLHAKMQACDWAALAPNLATLTANIQNGARATPPFAAIALLDEPHTLLAAASSWVEAKHPSPAPATRLRTRAGDGRVRIGYYSSDYHNHATSYLIAEMLEAHNRDRFEIFGFSFGPDTADDMRRRVTAAFDCFIDIRDKSDSEVAEMSASLGIDIAVDLKGYTGDSRVGLFAERCAPIQVNYLGFPGTMGASFIDYIIADHTLIPPQAQSGFSEKIVYLPGSYQANDSKRKISARGFTREDLRLPRAGFVFCCLNNPFKIFPATFDSWVRILSAVDRSVLWLFEDNRFAAENLRREARVRGIDASRLIFAERAPTDEHLARQRCADLFLDTLPCNAHTTASDALWMELPILTLPGRTFAGRVTASLLTALDLPELIASDQNEYEAKAIELASNPNAMAALKGKLAHNRRTSTLFDGKCIARKIEAAYEAMYARLEAGLPPEHIHIAAQ